MHGRVLLILALVVACGSSPKAADPDNLVVGTYTVRVYKRSFFPRQPALTGTVVLLDSVLPSHVYHWGLSQLNGCLVVRGDLSVLSVPGAKSRDSLPELTQWSHDTTGALRFSVFTGVDYAYSVKVTVRGSALRGVGHYDGVASPLQGTHWTKWRGQRIGPPDVRVCAPALEDDSLRAARNAAA